MWKSPLFEPPPEFKCSLCPFLNELFKEKKGNNDGLILFSHNVLDIEGFKSFFMPLLKNNKIKKLLYLELDIYSELDFKNNKNIIMKTFNSYEIFDIVDKNQFEDGTLYEILNYK